MKRFANLFVVILSICALFASAALAEGTEDYGYQKGQQENDARHAVYEQLENHDAPFDKSGYADAHVDGGAMEATLDADALVEAGVIDQETADRIAAYAAEKHADVSAIYEGIADMTPQQRAEAFESRKSLDGTVGDEVSELVTAGILTQEQADAIADYLNS